MEEKREQGIFIPLVIWTIKNLNINEKLVLSDIYNKSKLEDFKGYNKKVDTLIVELNIMENMAKDILNSLQKKGYISSNPEIYRNQGSFKKALARRYIKQDNFDNAERFIIPENNIFLRNGREGIFLSYQDIGILNAWGINKKDKRFSSKTRTRHLILILIIRKIAFIHNDEIYARFNIQDIADFLGISRQRAGRYITGDKEKTGKTKTKGLIEKQLYRNTYIRFLYKLSDKEAYQELYSKLGDLYIFTECKDTSKVIEVETIDGDIGRFTIGDVGNLYYINISDMQDLGMNINIDNKYNNIYPSS